MVQTIRFLEIRWHKDHNIEWQRIAFATTIEAKTPQQDPAKVIGKPAV